MRATTCSLGLLGISLIVSGVVVLTIGVRGFTDGSTMVSSWELNKTGGTSNPYPTQFVSFALPFICNRVCYNAGGHDFKCDDISYTPTVGMTGAQYTTVTNTKCSPLKRYLTSNSTCPFAAWDTSFSGNCDDSHDVYTDP